MKTCKSINTKIINIFIIQYIHKEHKFIVKSKSLNLKTCHEVAIRIFWKFGQFHIYKLDNQGYDCFPTLIYIRHKNMNGNMVAKGPKQITRFFKNAGCGISFISCGLSTSISSSLSSNGSVKWFLVIRYDDAIKNSVISSVSSSYLFVMSIMVLSFNTYCFFLFVGFIILLLSEKSVLLFSSYFDNVSEILHVID